MGIDVWVWVCGFGCVVGLSVEVGVGKGEVWGGRVVGDCFLVFG